MFSPFKSRAKGEKRSGMGKLDFLKNNLLAGGFKTAYVADIVVVFAFLFLALVGARKGAIRSIIGLVSTLTALILAFVFVDKLAAVFDGSLTKWLGGKLENTFLKINGFDLDVSAAGLEESLSRVSLPSFIKDFIVDKFGNETLEYGTTLALLAGAATAGLIVKIFSWFLLFLGVKIALALLSRLLTKIAEKISFINAVNVFLGAFFGIFKAFILVCGTLAVLSLIPADGITAFFDESFFVKFLYHENPLMKLLLN